VCFCCFFFQAEDGIRDRTVIGVQTCALPISKDNRRMIGAREFALMQPHAFFVTTARGFIHDEEALYVALRDKRIAGAGLDVWDRSEERRVGKEGRCGWWSDDSRMKQHRL